jgi:ribosomal protein S12 methylthiotransferase accessory factor
MLKTELRPGGQWPIAQWLVDEKIGLVRSFATRLPDPGGPALYSSNALLSNYGSYIPMERDSIHGSGAGLNETHARTSAVCEGVERYCLFASEGDTFLFGSYADLSRHFDLLHPDDCPLFHPAQYPAVGFAPFTPQTPLTWTWAYGLTRQKPILVPAVFVYLNYPRHPGEARLCTTISTGAACGASYTDAAVRGIYEIVERDAMMIMWLNRHACPRLHIGPHTPLGQTLQRRYKTDTLTQIIFWTTNDISIHACLALILDEVGGEQRSYVGLAANLDPQRAALGALTEAHEVRWGIHTTREMARILNDPSEIDNIHAHACYYAQGDRTHLLDFLLQGSQSIDLSELENFSRGDPAADLQTCLQKCEQAGVEVMVADLTKDDIRPTGLRVVRVVMPSLQPLTCNHNKPFLGGRRLYQVPVQLGWRQAPPARTEFNPAPHPFV